MRHTIRITIKVYGDNAVEIISKWRTEARRVLGIEDRTYDPYATYDVGVAEPAGDDPKAGGARYRATLRTFEASTRDGMSRAAGIDALKLRLGVIEFGSAQELDEAVKAEATRFYGAWPYVPVFDAEPIGDELYAGDVMLVTEQYHRRYGGQY